jgi:hypothetical protein
MLDLRVGQMNEHSSCWVRVSSHWAGDKFGAIFIPRIGMEVIIDHLHLDAVEQAVVRVAKARNWLTGKGSRPYGKKEGASLTKPEKNKILKDCFVPEDLRNYLGLNHD